MPARDAIGRPLHPRDVRREVVEAVRGLGLGPEHDGAERDRDRDDDARLPARVLQPIHRPRWYGPEALRFSQGGWNPTLARGRSRRMTDTSSGFPASPDATAPSTAASAVTTRQPRRHR